MTFMAAQPRVRLHEHFVADLLVEQAAFIARSNVFNAPNNFQKQSSLCPACSSEKDRTINSHLERWYAAQAGSQTLEVAGDSHSIYVSNLKGKGENTP